MGKSGIEKYGRQMVKKHVGDKGCCFRAHMVNSRVFLE